MKKLAIMILSIMMVGCSSTPDEKQPERIYKDGTYKTTANGYGGDFQVETSIKDDVIADIVVKENNETPSIGGVAIEQLIDKMKEKSTYDVDTISGATKTSQGLKDAVKAGMEKGKNPAKQISEDTNKETTQDGNK